MPDGGTARADFPGGDAHQLYRSIKKVLALPKEMRLFMCHDYAPGGREIRLGTARLARRQRAASLLEAYALGRLPRGGPPSTAALLPP